MELHLRGLRATEEEERALDRVLGPAKEAWFGAVRDPDRDGRVARGGLPRAQALRHLLLPALHAVQDAVGWVSPGALESICRRLAIPPAEAWGVLTFYHLLDTETRPPIQLHVCTDLICQSRGGRELFTELGNLQRRGELHQRFCVQESACLGLCERPPAVFVRAAGREPLRVAMAPLALGDVTELISSLSACRLPARFLHFQWKQSVPQLGSPGLRLLSRIGTVDPTSLDAYLASGGYRALEKAVELGAAGVVEEIVKSRLVGRGGAAFPAGRKWEAVRRAQGSQKFVVVNADESEPGTFKDRVLLEGDPFAIVEAATIAGFATGAEKGFVYLRGEYPLAEERMANAIAQARDQGWLGKNVGGYGFQFDLELRRGAGAYICGEETALFNSIEGKRGEPRSKPPFPVEVGLFGCPTAVNNVETLANVPWILLDGGEAFARVGSGSSTGTKLFCVSGSVQCPGVYEVPFGTRLSELLELAGGVAQGSQLKAVLLGGAAGSFVGPESLDLELTFESARQAGATLGSGVVMVFDQEADLARVVRTIARFFRHESCGQCVPCRIGTVRLEEWIERQGKFENGEKIEEELAMLRELAQAMRDASICGLGQTAFSALESALRRFGWEGLFGKEACRHGG